MKKQDKNTLSTPVIEAMLNEFVMLQADINRKSQRLEDLKTMLKNTGTFITPNYAVVVNWHERRGLVSLEKAKYILGQSFLESKGLIQLLRYQTVSVSHRVDL